MTRIDILHVDHCPGVQPTVDRVRKIAERLGLDIALRMVRVTSLEDALQVRFLGSPTVRVDDIDIDPSSSDCADFGLCCRVYDGEGVPPEAMIETALRKHV